MSDFLQRLQAAVGDGYRIERELTRGGMSRLFLATEASLNREVVIKVLPPEWASDVSAERFRQEIQVAAHLQHPNVLPVLTAGAGGDLIYYVMPYVRGESLRHRLVTEGKLPLPDALRLLHEVADALAYAHAHGVVHRDIKPENILLQQGHAVLADFGVARALAEARTGDRLTETGMVVGTPGYMSPEQAAGDSHIDARADVYALAVVGYEMLAGSPPFTGSTAQAVMAAHLTETPQSLERVRPETPRSVAGAITQALAKNPLDRLQTAAAFRDALVHAGGGTLRAAPARRRWLAIAGAAVVLAIAAVVLWPRGYHVSGNPRHSLIIFPFDNRTGDPEFDWLGDAAMNSMGLTMAHWRDLRVYDDERTESLLRRAGVANAGSLDFAAAQRLARDARVGTLVLGDVRREGQELVFEAKLHDVGSGERLSTEIVRTPLSSDPRSAFDSLSARILRVSGAEPGERPGVVAQTTRSVEAYRAYLKGTGFLHQFELDSADRYLSHAIALDSGFALAYLQLRNVEGWHVTGGDPARRRELVAKAARHGANLPPRFRALVQYHVAWEAGQYGQARAIMERLIGRDSTDVEAWYQLGEATFHGGSTRFPHPDTLANLGTALAAFQHVLALDSSYTIAYRHTTDILAMCASPNYPLVCLPDSAVYGMPGDLEQRYGAARVRAARERARTELAGTVRAWIAATPASPRVREQAIDLLGQQGLWGQARTQLEALRALSGTLTVHAEAAEAHILLGQQRYPEAADAFAGAFARAGTAELVTTLTPNATWPAFLASGRAREGQAAMRAYFDALPDSSALLPLPAGVAAGDLLGTIDLGARSVMAAANPETPDSTVRRYYHAANDSLRRLLPGDTARRQVISRLMAPLFMVPLFAVTLDTTFLTIPGVPFRAAIPKEWQGVAGSLAALQQGDTSAARRMARDAYPAQRHVPVRGLQFLALYLWGRVFAELHDPARAVQAYALLDSAPPGTRWPYLQLRSWAERGALYQATGDTTRAIAMYQKFIDAWRDADPELQPQVERARRAVAALKGEATPRVPS